jgi:hypothetical protein
MKKVLWMVLLMLSMAVMLHAQEANSGNQPVTNESSDTENGWERGLGGIVRVGYSFPIISGFLDSPTSTAETVGYGLAKVALAFAFSSVAVGGGVQYDVIPHFLSPGLYFDVNFNLFSWAIMGLFEKDFVLLQLGFRAYNQFSISFFAIEPFFGGNFVYLSYDKSAVPILLMQAGFVINLGKFSFEYSYHFPAKDFVSSVAFTGIHRITLGGIVFKSKK